MDYKALIIFFITNLSNVKSLSEFIAANDCFPTSNNSLVPNCKFLIEASERSVSTICVKLNEAFQVVGEFKKIKISCSASYPIEADYYGVNPTEAVHQTFKKDVKPHTDRKMKAHIVEMEISSVQELFKYYSSKIKGLSKAHDYSRSGEFFFYGIFNKTLARSVFLFLEDSAKPSFLRNEKIRLQNLTNLLHIPCQPTHFNAKVELQAFSKTMEYMPISNFQYEPSKGFYINKNSQIQQYECVMRYNEKIVDKLTIKYIPPEIHYGFDTLPQNKKDVDIYYEIVSNENGRDVDIHPKCTITLSEGSKGWLANIEAPNYAIVTLNGEFTLPEYFNQSYTTRLGAREATSEAGTVRIEAWGVQPANHRVGTTFCSSDSSVEYAHYYVTVGLRHLKLYQDNDWISRRETASISLYYAIFPKRKRETLYANTEITFVCKVQIAVVFPPVIWYIERKNGSITEELVSHKWDRDQSYFTKNITVDIVRVYCAGSFFHSVTWRNISYTLELQNGSLPSINTTLDYKLKTDATYQIKCEAEGDPIPIVYWQRKGRNISVTSELGSSTLEIEKAGKDIEGEYFCIAKNAIGQTKKAFQLEIEG